ncbi:RuvC family protein [Kozakia baliensis]|uniref:hypothetical protein n=1 Tax=Kozakia baliensis TaxID=153496 RepID=UPI00068D3F34|nr:hypothetical protein [Kozakia baliensis]
MSDCVDLVVGAGERVLVSPGKDRAHPPVCDQKASPLIASIDPGVKGAIAIMRQDGSIVTIADMPSVKQKIGKTMRTRICPADIANLLAGCSVSHVYVEQVHTMPGQNGFVLGETFGVIQGIAAALQIPMTLISPVKWKKALGLNGDKGASIARAKMLWPGEAARFARMRDDGRAESALIGHYALKSLPVA